MCVFVDVFDVVLNVLVENSGFFLIESVVMIKV